MPFQAYRVLVLFLLFCFSCSPRKESTELLSQSIVDDLGNPVALKSVPHRIVSLAPSITETLFALGLHNAVVGVTDYCDFPAEAKTKTRVGGIANPNLEAIVALNPDLVVMSVAGNIRGDCERLKNLGISVFVTNPQSVESVFKSIRDLGSLTGRKALADSIVEDLEQERDSLVLLAGGKPVTSALLLLSLQPIIAAGPGTFLDELIRLAHASNVVQTAVTAYPILSREEILRRQPEVILLTNDIGVNVSRITEQYPEWKNLPAFRNRRVHLVDANLISRPGPRIVKGLAELVNAIH